MILVVFLTHQRGNGSESCVVGVDYNLLVQFQSSCVFQLRLGNGVFC